MIMKIFKNYQSFVNNLFYDYPKIEVKTKHPINYVKIIFNFLINFIKQVSNWYFKSDIQKAEAERNKLLF